MLVLLWNVVLVLAQIVVVDLFLDHLYLLLNGLGQVAALGPGRTLLGSHIFQLFIIENKLFDRQLLVRISHLDLLMAALPVNGSIPIDTRRLKVKFLSVIQLRPLLTLENRSIALWIKVLLLGKLHLLLKQLLIDFGNILADNLGVAMRCLIAIYVLISHLLDLLHLLLLHVAGWGGATVVVSARLVRGHAVVSTHLRGALPLHHGLVPWRVQEVDLGVDLVRGPVRWVLVRAPHLLLLAKTVGGLSRVLRVVAWVPYCVARLPSVWIDVDIDDGVASLGRDLMLSSLLMVALVQLHLILVLWGESRDHGEGWLPLEVLELLILPNNLRGIIKVLWVLTLALALIRHSGWSEQILGQRPRHIHLGLNLLRLLLARSLNRVVKPRNVVHIYLILNYFFLHTRFLLFQGEAIGAQPDLGSFGSLLALKVEVEGLLDLVGGRGRPVLDNHMVAGVWPEINKSGYVLFLIFYLSFEVLGILGGPNRVLQVQLVPGGGLLHLNVGGVDQMDVLSVVQAVHATTP
jgi:hypothetical protein